MVRGGSSASRTSGQANNSRTIEIRSYCHAGGKTRSQIGNASLNLSDGIRLGILLLLIAIPAAQAQTFTVLHNFTGGADGGQPASALTMDAAGNLYGTASLGGHTADNCYNTCGTVFRLKRTGQSWVLNPLYEFAGGSDGANPAAKVIFGPDGSLYGLTPNGGSSCPNNTQYGCGTVFNLRPQPTNCVSVFCAWQETVLYRFNGGANDGAVPEGSPTFDHAGNLYGTTFDGGYSNQNACVFGQGYSCGTVFELTRAHGDWAESLLYTFLGGSDGSNPEGGLTFDASGNLYGTTLSNGQYYGGTVFELTHPAPVGPRTLTTPSRSRTTAGTGPGTGSSSMPPAICMAAPRTGAPMEAEPCFSCSHQVTDGALRYSIALPGAIKPWGRTATW